MKNNTEGKTSYLEMIQQIISRMANNSFLIKGWSLTLSAAIFTIASQESEWWLVLIALLPALSFWGLDAYYLQLERIFRHLYKDAVDDNRQLFDIDIKDFSNNVGDDYLYRNILISRSVLCFHLPIVLATVALCVFKYHYPKKEDEKRMTVNVECTCLSDSTSSSLSASPPAQNKTHKKKCQRSINLN